MRTRLSGSIRADRALLASCLIPFAAAFAACSSDPSADRSASSAASEATSGPDVAIDTPRDCGGSRSLSPGCFESAGGVVCPTEPEPESAEAQGFGAKLRAADVLNDYGRECQPHVGLMPAFDCLDFPEIPTEQDGVDLVVKERGGRLVIERGGAIVWDANDPARTDPRCDNPSWASTPCYPGTRVGLVESGGASWAILCRRQSVQRSDDPDFGLVGVIAHDQKTGATCFFDKNPRSAAITKAAFPQPGAADAATRAAAKRTWAAPAAAPAFENCLECHAAAPFIRSPFVDSVPLSRAMDPTGSYFVVGTVFQRAWAAPRALSSEDASCSDCHRIGESRQARMFAHLAIGGPEIDAKSSDTRLAVVSGSPTRWPLGFFMPPRGRRLGSLAAWERQYGAERRAMLACLATPGGKGCTLDDFFGASP